MEERGLFLPFPGKTMWFTADGGKLEIKKGLRSCYHNINLVIAGEFPIDLLITERLKAVSYTHLDVYKRQV